jgi:predicted RND superfamily exporter protein
MKKSELVPLIVVLIGVTFVVGLLVVLAFQDV